MSMYENMYAAEHLTSGFLNKAAKLKGDTPSFALRVEISCILLLWLSTCTNAELVENFSPESGNPEATLPTL